MSPERKKLIEVALPIEAVNRESAREKSIRHGHPSTLHLWWARRPLASCRAVLFGQLVDDPSSWPDRFPSEEEQDRERQRLFRIIEELVKWENSNSDVVLDAARLEIARSVARTRVSEGNGGSRDEEVLDTHVEAKRVRSYIAEVVPPLHDPFAGGGAIPLEAQRLGLRAIATDLNPVAVLINKAQIEIPSRFAGKNPVASSGEPTTQAEIASGRWPGATGLAEDVRRYGAWISKEAYRRIGHLYPDVELPSEHGGLKTKVIAWIWARTVECPNPAFAGIHVPLVSNFFLSTRKGQETWVEPVVEGRSYEFEIRTGKPPDRKLIGQGTKIGRGANFRCILSDTPIEPDYIKAEGQAGRMSARLMAIVAQGKRKRVFLAPIAEMESVALSAKPEFVPDGELPANRQYCNPPLYGLDTFGDLFTARQLVALTTISDLVGEARIQAASDARDAGWSDDGIGLEDGGSQATAYADAVATYLGLGVSKLADAQSSLCRWKPSMTQTIATFGRQAFPIVWDYAESNVFGGMAGDYTVTLHNMMRVLDQIVTNGPVGTAMQMDAARLDASDEPVLVSTDPPYFDNVPYADLSDFFYIWLRRVLHGVFPKLFQTVLVPKSTELVANPVRQGGKAAAEDFFLSGMSTVVGAVREKSATGMPIAWYYAFKQAEASADGLSSTGWEKFLASLIDSELVLTATWPLRTELGNRMRSIGSNALASSIVLSCRRRASDSQTATRGDFRRQLRAELPGALALLHKGNIAPVDMAQASIGPGMAVFSGYHTVLEADGSAMSVRAALQLINQVTDEALGEEEGELDRDSRFALTWFETHGFEEGSFGDAETLATARAVSVSGVQEAGVLRSAAGKVRLLNRKELPGDWDPEDDDRLTVWEAAQHLIKRLEEMGEQPAADLMAKLGPMAEQARGLAYRLFTSCERSGWAEEAQSYNGLVLAWPELEKLAGSAAASGSPAAQPELFS